jgi:hypothetical protein
MLQSLQSDEGIKAYYSSFSTSFLNFDDNDDDIIDVSTADESVESLEDQQDIEGYAVENAFIEEKEDACNAIGEIAENVSCLNFLPFIDSCFRDISPLVDDYSAGLRKASVLTIGRLAKVWYDPTIIGQLSEMDKDSLDILINSTLRNMSASARTDGDATVVVATLESMEMVLKGLKNGRCPIELSTIESILVTVEDLLNNKAHCQEDDEDGATSDELAEIEGLLLETTGSVLGPLAAAVGGVKILPLFQPLIQLLMAKLVCSFIARIV